MEVMLFSVSRAVVRLSHYDAAIITVNSSLIKLARRNSNNYDNYSSRDSSVSIVSDYGLDDRGWIPDGGKGFFF
jgi:hypothetical protein